MEQRREQNNPPSLFLLRVTIQITGYRIPQNDPQRCEDDDVVSFATERFTPSMALVGFTHGPEIRDSNTLCSVTSQKQVHMLKAKC